MFCPIDAELVDRVQRAMDGSLPASDLPGDLVADLRRHGFGGPPRAARPVSRSVQIQLTNACNLACDDCCTNSGAARRNETTREQVFALVEQTARQMGPGTSVALLGGEPLLVPWALDVAEHALDCALGVTIFSNGLLIADDAVADRVTATMRRGATVRIRLAGASRDACNATSGAERFDRAVEGIRKLDDRGVRPVVDLMLLPDQVDDVARHLPSVRRLLLAGVEIALGIAYLSGRERGAHLFPSRAALESALDRIAFDAGEVIAASAVSPLAERREGCGCALGHPLHVRSDGALFTCFKMEERVGDLRTMSFEAALRGLHASARPAHSLARCRDCPLATLCGGGCRSENLQYTGDADEPVCGPWRVRVLSELLAERVQSSGTNSDTRVARTRALRAACGGPCQRRAVARCASGCGSTRAGHRCTRCFAARGALATPDRDLTRPLVTNPRTAADDPVRWRCVVGAIPGPGSDGGWGRERGRDGEPGTDQALACRGAPFNDICSFSWRWGARDRPSSGLTPCAGQV